MKTKLATIAIAFIFLPFFCIGFIVGCAWITAYCGFKWSERIIFESGK